MRVSVCIVILALLLPPLHAWSAEVKTEFRAREPILVLDEPTAMLCAFIDSVRQDAGLTPLSVDTLMSLGLRPFVGEMLGSAGVIGNDEPLVADLSDYVADYEQEGFVSEAPSLDASIKKLLTFGPFRGALLSPHFNTMIVVVCPDVMDEAVTIVVFVRQLVRMSPIEVRCESGNRVYVTLSGEVREGRDLRLMFCRGNAESAQCDSISGWSRDIHLGPDGKFREDLPIYELGAGTFQILVKVRESQSPHLTLARCHQFTY